MVQEQIALSRIEIIEQARLFVLKAAHTIDCHGNKAARKQVGIVYQQYWEHRATRAVGNVTRVLPLSSSLQGPVVRRPISA